LRLATYIAKRAGYTVFVLLGLSILIFTLARVLPGDPARMALSPRAPEWAIEKLREQLRLNEPLPIQYIYWLRDAFSGSLGESLVTRRDVLVDISEFLPATLELLLFALIFDVIIAIPIGMLAGRKANTWIDNLVRGFAYIGVTIPAFVFAIIFLLIFGYILQIAPTVGRLSPGMVPPPRITGLLTIDSLITGNFSAFVDAVSHLILPSFALALGPIAQEARITRASVVENLNKDYILASTAHGLPERLIVLKYLMKPSLIPTVSIMGLDIASLMGWAFLVESIFNWPGMSRYGIIAMLRKDLNAIVGVVMVTGLVFAIANIIVDVIVSLLDPRIRMVERAK